MQKSYRIAVYIAVGLGALVLLVLAVVSPEHFQRATAAVSPVLAVVGSVLALLHLSPETSPPVAAHDVQAGDTVEVVPAPDSGAGDHLEVIPVDVPASDTKFDAAGTL